MNTLLFYLELLKNYQDIEIESNDIQFEHNNLIDSNIIITLLKQEIKTVNNKYEIIQDMLSGELENALNDIDLLTEKIEYFQNKVINDLELKIIQLEIDLRQKDIEIYNLKINALKK